MNKVDGKGVSIQSSEPFKKKLFTREVDKFLLGIGFQSKAIGPMFGMNGNWAANQRHRWRKEDEQQTPEVDLEEVEQISFNIDDAIRKENESLKKQLEATRKAHHNAESEIKRLQDVVEKQKYSQEQFVRHIRVEETPKISAGTPSTVPYDEFNEVCKELAESHEIIKGLKMAIKIITTEIKE